MNRRAFIQSGILTLTESLVSPSVKTEITTPGSSRSEIHVAPYGDDSNEGTEERPFASLDRARCEVRAIKRQFKGPVTTWVHEGTYYLERPLVFGAEDSGSPDASVTYAAWKGDKVVLSGGRKLACNWKSYRGGILCCSLPDIRSGKSPAFTQLFVNCKRQHRARYPHYDAGNPLVNGNGYVDVADVDEAWPCSQFHFDPALFTKKRWKTPQAAVVHMFPCDYWGNLQWEVADVDWDTNAIELGWGGFQLNQQLFGKAATGIGRTELYREGYKSRFFVENVFEELSAPGEWYLDRNSGILYLIPPDGVDISAAIIEVPVLEQVIEFRGSQRQPVQHIRLSGFRIAHTASTFLRPYDAPTLGDWTIHRGGAVFLEGTTKCAVEQCFFDAVGGNALFLNEFNRETHICANRFTEAGDSAICLVGSQQKIQGTCRPFASNCVVSNNLIHDCGIFGKQIAGVFLSVTERIVISHNHIFNMPRAAICVNDGWGGGHVIEWNSIHDTVRETHDHGPFNSWGRGRFWCMVQSHGNASHGSGYHDADPAYPFAYPEEDGYTVIIRNNIFREPLSIHQLGIDLDDGSSHYHIYNNVCVGISIKLREGDNRTVENNIFIRPANPPAFHQGYEGNLDRFVRNIIVTTASTNQSFGKSSVPGDLYQINQPPARGPIARELDYNLFFSDLGEFFASVTPRGGKRMHCTMKEWQSLGYDIHSIYADPQFIDLERGDLRLQNDSPAFQIGFSEFDISRAGLLPNFPQRWRDV